MSPRVSAEHGLQQRERILDAAAICLCRRGYHETTVQDICDEAGLSKGGLYTYFKSKEEILAALIEENFLRPLEQAQEVAAGAGTAVEKLDRVARFIIDRLVPGDHQTAATPQLHLEIWAEASKNHHLQKQCARGYERWRAFLAGLLREGIAAGQLKPDVDPDALSTVLVAVFDGLSLQEGITKVRVDWPRIAQALQRALGEGVIAGARGRSRSSGDALSR